MYFIDPFESRSQNGILVFCDRTTNATCIKPETSTFKVKAWLSTNSNLKNYVYFMNEINQPEGVSTFLFTN